jgi:diadenosine tetraphosphatase ApaH/serine/threonine PP2A family protein phosphatase
MRTLIISDVHANLTALEAVLSDAAPFDRVWCLGDVVGYGPDPNACIEVLQNLPGLQCVKGNHDAAVSGDIRLDAFNYEARKALDWMVSQVTTDHLKWLSSLEEKIDFDEITLVHGSPRWPIWEYVMDLRIARQNMNQFETPICLVGHTHIPCVFQMESSDVGSTRMILMATDMPFSLNHKSIVNPGSVGQPRDHNPKASYMVYDDEQNLWVHRRVDYDIHEVQKRIRAAGLPLRHADRLSEGW